MITAIVVVALLLGDFAVLAALPKRRPLRRKDPPRRAGVRRRQPRVFTCACFLLLFLLLVGGPAALLLPGSAGSQVGSGQTQIPRWKGPFDDAASTHTVTRTETAISGPVTAKFSYTDTIRGRLHDYSDLHISISRASVTLLDEPVDGPCGNPKCFWVPGRAPRPSLALEELDGDGEPEVILNAYALLAGGFHCCDWAFVYSYDASENRYVLTRHDFLDLGYRLIDEDGDGSAEFQSANARFGFVFTSWAGSGFPIEVWRFHAGRFENATRSYPGTIVKDADRWFRRYNRYRRLRYHDVRGILAAYVADEYLLDQGRAGWRIVRRAVKKHQLVGRGPYGPWPVGRRYLTRLHRFLKQHGYIR